MREPELIEALREQLEELKQQQQQQQQWGRQGLHQASSVQPLGDRDRMADSDDSDDDSEGCQVSQPTDEDGTEGQHKLPGYTCFGVDGALMSSGGGVPATTVLRNDSGGVVRQPPI